MKKGLLAVLVFGSAALGAAAPDMLEGKWWKRPRVATEIGLTSDQSQEIETIFVRSRLRLIDLKAELEKKQLGLQQAMEDPTADRPSIEKKIDEVENARAELQKTRALMVLDMKQVLKQPQWDRLLQMQQARRERMEERRQQMQEERRQQMQEERRQRGSDERRPPEAGRPPEEKRREPRAGPPPNRPAPERRPN